MGSLGRKIFCSATPHFFKIIVEGTSRDHRLKIPKKFMVRYGEDLSKSVYLKLPSGSEWEVELTRCNGKAWFERGWPEFSRFCSLDYGTFLVFQYEGNSRFGVCIFDKSATEIDYPLTMPKIEEVDEDDLSIEISEDLPPCPKGRENSLLLCPPCKKMRTSLSGKLDVISGNGDTQTYDTVVFEKPMTNKESHCSRGKIEEETDNAIKTDGGCSARPPRFLKQTCRKHVGRIKPLTTTEKAIALQRAEAFKADKPSFKMTIQPSHFYGDTSSLPSEFAKKHLIKIPAGIAILSVPDGRRWSLKFKYDLINSKARLWNGWLPFVRDNNLKVGDVCVFVLIDCKELLFEVFFFPTTIEATNSPFTPVKKPNISGQVTQRPSSSLRTSRSNLEAANKFIPENPFFLVTLRAYERVKLNPFVPAEFVRSFIKESKQNLKLQVKDRLWPVKLIRCTGKYSARFSGGWTAFATEHRLEEGDVCIFELMDINDNVLKVHIFKC